MKRWQRYLQQESRSRRSLWRFAIAMLLLGAVVGYGSSLLRPRNPALLEERLLASVVRQAVDPTLPVAWAPSQDVVAALTEEVQEDSVRFIQVLDVLPKLGGLISRSDDERLRAILAARYGAEPASLATDALAASRDENDPAWERLRALAESDRPPRYASHALGLVELQRLELHAAFENFRREGEHPDAVESRRQAINALVLAKDWDELEKLYDEPGYRSLISPSILLQVAIEKRDWPGIVKWVPISQFTGHDPGILGLMLVTGGAWAFFLVHLGESSSASRGHVWLLAGGFIAGAISTTPTIYAVIWQDDFLGFSPRGDFLRAIAYYVGGVGLREEACKLLLFVPLLPFLLKRRDELEAFIVASFVGLGFAVEENGNYFLQSGGSAVAGRFLTANFLHVALTGLNGLALYRACRRGWSGLNDFLSMLGITVIAHGLYDALPQFADAEIGAFLGMAVFVLICQYYFMHAHGLRSNARMLISLSGAFVAGLSLVAGTMFVYHMTRLGAGPGATLVFPELLGSVIFVIIFFRQFDEPLGA